MRVHAAGIEGICVVSMKYIRDHYGVPAKRGARVAFTSAANAVQGTIIGSRGAYIRVRWEGARRVFTHHPTDSIIYLPGTGDGAAG